jgi:hypothetical protein
LCLKQRNNSSQVIWNKFQKSYMLRKVQLY